MSEKYELVAVFGDQLKDEECESLTAAIEKQITEGGATITEKDVWGKKQLAYKINKRSYGYYVLFNFDAPQALVAELNRQFRINDSIIRHSIVKKDKFAPDGIAAPAGSFGDKDDKKDDKEKSSNNRDRDTKKESKSESDDSSSKPVAAEKKETAEVQESSAS